MDKHVEKYQMLGLNIAYYRKARGLTQEQLSDKLFISRTHLSRIEAPNVPKSFSIDVIFEIADVLGVEVAQLFEKRT